MKISTLYQDLLNNPHAPKPYRELKDHYYKLGRYDEANAFAFLLRNVFNELPPISRSELDADVSNADSQRHANNTKSN
jgi:hypothetical protein